MKERLLVTSINARKTEPETTYLYSVPTENAEDHSDGDQKYCCQTHNQHQSDLIINYTCILEQKMNNANIKV